MRLSDGVMRTIVVPVGAIASWTSILSVTSYGAPGPSSTIVVLSGASATSSAVATMSAWSLSWTVTSTLRTVAWSNDASRLMTDWAETTTRSPSGRTSFTA